MKLFFLFHQEFSDFSCMVGMRNGPSKDVHILVFRTCKCVAIHSKRDFVDVPGLRILKSGDYTGLSRTAQYKSWSLIKSGGGEGQCQRRHCDDRGRDKEEYVTIEGDVRVIWDHKPSNMATLGSWTGRKPDSPPEHPDVARRQLHLSRWKPFHTSYLQNYKMI